MASHGTSSQGTKRVSASGVLSPLITIGLSHKPEIVKHSRPARTPAYSHFSHSNYHTNSIPTSGIVYCNSASACTESVADTAIFLLLSTYRAFTWSFLAARSCIPAQFNAANQNIATVTHNPGGTVLGIIGLGKIGFRLAHKAKSAFDMRIAYHDVVRIESREKELGDVTWCETLEELLQRSDCVVIATPFEGNVLLGRKEFRQFKKGARLVNIARGKLIDEEALVEALDEGIISAAGLDVHADEPNVNSKLAGKDNVMVLSKFGFHRGWFEVC